MATGKTLEQLKSELEAAAAKVAEGLNSGSDEEAIKALKKTATAALDRYNTKAAEDAFMEWVATEENPVKAAIIARYVPRAKRLSYGKDKVSGRFTYALSDNELKIDLYHMMEVVGREKFANGNWADSLEKMVYIVAGALDKALGEDPDFKYTISSAAHAFEFGPGADPASNKSVIKALQFVIDQILFIDDGEGKNTIKAVKPNWVYISNALTKQGKALGEIVIGNTHKMAELVCDVICMALTDKKHKLTVN